MKIVIDANVFFTYYLESEKGIDSNLTGPVTPIIDRLGCNDFAYLDDGGQIEQEWRNVVGEREWFKAWFTSAFIDDKLVIVETETCHDLLTNLYRLNFPKGTIDTWYIRTAKAAIKSKPTNDESWIISEDLHFFSPKDKKNTKGQQRLEILKNCSGNVQKHLHASENINVTCVINYLDSIKT